MNERVILRTVDECEMSRCLLVNPLLARHLGGLGKMLYSVVAVFKKRFVNLDAAQNFWRGAGAGSSEISSH